MTLYLLHNLQNAQEHPWYPPLMALEHQLILSQSQAKSKQESREKVLEAYAQLVRSLVENQQPDLASAVADSLMCAPSVMSDFAAQGKKLPTGVRKAFLADLDEICTWVQRDWPNAVKAATKQDVPGLRLLAFLPDAPWAMARKNILDNLKEALWQGNTETILKLLRRAYREHGTGILSQYWAYRYQAEAFIGITHPPKVSHDRLMGLERQLTQLVHNTEAFLDGKRAHHTLLYGMRGSGKSTAVRALVPQYAPHGLRLIEVSPLELKRLSDILEHLRPQPHRYILFVDDLAFETGDTGYQVLKTLLEGNLSEHPSNVLIYATSNRRNLVKEQFKDRPDPLDDDVHRWDTVNERLALSDRFGLTITFPNTNQKRYLEIVESLLNLEGLDIENWRMQAVRFADWGNGYTGRTAEQFIQQLKTQHTPTREHQENKAAQKQPKDSLEGAEGSSTKKTHTKSTPVPT